MHNKYKHPDKDIIQIITRMIEALKKEVRTLQNKVYIDHPVYDPAAPPDNIINGTIFIGTDNSLNFKKDNRIYTLGGFTEGEPLGPELPDPPDPPPAGPGPYEHFQTVADTDWVIVHNMGRNPEGIAVFDDDDVWMDYDSFVNDTTDQTTITFLSAVTGRALLS